MKTKRFQIFVSVFLVILGLNTTANAASVSIALTATIQESDTEPNPGVHQYVSKKIRITQKDILDRLSLHYTIPDGGQLAHSGGFQILDANGVFSAEVSSTHLQLINGDFAVRNGLRDTNPGKPDKYKQSSSIVFQMDINIANFFDLTGIDEINFVVNGSSFGTATHKMTFLGTGNFDGKPCTLSGKLTLRVNIEPA